MKSIWLPPLYVEFEDTGWHNDSDGEMVAFRVIKNGEPTTSEIKFFKGDAKQIVRLLEAAGIATEERKRGVPETPRHTRRTRR
ncbi:hypothetical protein [Pararhizobium sp.]|uniref:hypothetical protein n=1 Tax=Pararhizobium sp. TaxID=1977563 RepID=UPI003D0C118C